MQSACWHKAKTTGLSRKSKDDSDNRQYLDAVCEVSKYSNKIHHINKRLSCEVVNQAEKRNRLTEMICN